ncbi:MAG: cation:proton antiporter [Alphaproteobacteria bacterium]
MEHALINTLIASIVTAFIFGMIAKKLKLPAIFGYLLAGVAIGPYTPGFVADVELARQLAEIGIILLMFGVGLHFSLRDLMEVRKIALTGALAQILSATTIGAIAAVSLGYITIQGLIFGFSLSVASTIVLLRSLEQRRMLESTGGKIAIGWLVIEDIAMVLALVMLPVLADMIKGTESVEISVIAATAFIVLLKITAFFLFMMVVGRRFLPWLLVSIARLRSSELSTLGTLAIALGFASIAYVVFNASFALGAFLAGMMLNESEIGKKSAESSLPMRDAFSVLFFVSVGMLFDPDTLLLQPKAVLLTFLVIVVAKGLAALLITRWFRQSTEVSYTVAIGLAQIGEFSFILGGMALTKGLITQDLYNLMLAGAMLSIVANPFLFRLLDRIRLKPA